MPSILLRLVLGALFVTLAACGDGESQDQSAPVCQGCGGAGGGVADASAGTGGIGGGAGGSVADASAGTGGIAGGSGGSTGEDAAAGGSDASDGNDSSPPDDGGCQFPWADCDMDTANGCEADLSANVDNCGACWHSCNLQVNNATEALCVAGDGGQSVCDYVSCAMDFWDPDANRENGCEYYCVKKGESDSTCDNLDDNCDGVRDEGVDKCTDAANCGACGRNCARPHAIGKCVPTPMEPCDQAHTSCAIDHCDDGWADANHSMMDGCEMQVP